MISASAALLSCSPSVEVLPKVPPSAEPIEVLISGKLICDCDKQFVPKTVENSQAFHDNFTIRYEHKDVGGHAAKIKGVALVGRLEILEGSNVLKTYKSSAVLKVVSEFATETLSELRRRGLTVIRNNIEAQMMEDREFLKSLGGHIRHQ